MDAGFDTHIPEIELSLVPEFMTSVIDAAGLELLINQFPEGSIAALADTEWDLTTRNFFLSFGLAIFALEEGLRKLASLRLLTRKGT